MLQKWKHALFFFTLSFVLSPRQPPYKTDSFTCTDQVAGVPWYSVSSNKLQSSDFSWQRRILGIEGSYFNLALNARDKGYSIVWIKAYLPEGREERRPGDTERFKYDQFRENRSVKLDLEVLGLIRV